ncbi:MAG TPA: branched-chain amino acid ABC transporter permease [Nitriliruptorales bacterium]|nr:branched-chain amino acid ABC transporter permease [Nitriliruptorales bacterium]
MNAVATAWLPRIPAVAVLAALPLLVSDFRLGVVTEILIFGLLAASLDLLVGFSGLPSLGHATYFGVGGYAAALVARDLTGNVLAGLVVAAVVTLVVALVTGFLAVRTRGVYFLMLTLAFAQLLFSLVQTWTPVTGGSNGMSVPSVDVWPGTSLDSTGRFYLFTVVTVGLCYLLLRRLVDSPFGRSIVGIRENEARMRSVGYATLRYKLAAFTVAGVVGGLSGGLFAQYQRFISPGNVAFQISALALIMVIVGGVGTLYGPAIGAAAVILLRDELSRRYEHWELILGIVFALFVYFLPGGLGGGAQRLRSRRAPMVASHSEAAPPAITQEIDL